MLVLVQRSERLDESILHLISLTARGSVYLIGSGESVRDTRAVANLNNPFAAVYASCSSLWQIQGICLGVSGKSPIWSLTRSSLMLSLAQKSSIASHRRSAYSEKPRAMSETDMTD
jgi:hypothetical protein